MINSIANNSSINRAVSKPAMRESVGVAQAKPVVQVAQVERVSTEYFSQPQDHNTAFPKVIKVDSERVETPLVDRRRRFVQQQPGFQRPELQYQVNQQMIQREELDRLVGIDIRV